MQRDVHLGKCRLHSFSLFVPLKVLSLLCAVAVSLSQLDAMSREEVNDARRRELTFIPVSFIHSEVAPPLTEISFLQCHSTPPLRLSVPHKSIFSQALPCCETSTLPLPPANFETDLSSGRWKGDESSSCSPTSLVLFSEAQTRAKRKEEVSRLWHRPNTEPRDGILLFSASQTK